MYFGAAVLGGAYYVDRWLGCSQDFAFWFYLAGVVTFWFGLTLQVLLLLRLPPRKGVARTGVDD
jgi:hypothetical protein